MSHRLENFAFTFAGFCILLSVLVVWQLVSLFNVVPSSIFPPVSSVLVALYGETANGQIGTALVATLVRMLEGFAIASAIGVSAGVVIGLSITASRSLDPLVQFLRPLPAVVLIPLIILYFGMGDMVVLIPVIFGCVWPILLNTIDGVKSIDPMYRATADGFRIKGVRRITKVTIPAIAPFILSGMRVSLALAWIIAITAEFISAVVSHGIGVLIFYQFNAGNLKSMYASIFAAAIAAYVVNRLFVFLEDRLVPWHGRWQKTQ